MTGTCRSSAARMIPIVVSRFLRVERWVGKTARKIVSKELFDMNQHSATPISRATSCPWPSDTRNWNHSGQAFVTLGRRQAPQRDLLGGVRIGFYAQLQMIEPLDTREAFPARHNTSDRSTMLVGEK